MRPMVELQRENARLREECARLAAEVARLTRNAKAAPQVAPRTDAEELQRRWGGARSV